MRETKLLTEKQISRRKTAAIWLIGAGVLLSIFFRLFDDSIIPYLLINHNHLFLELYDILSEYLPCLLLVGGLLAIKRLADRVGKMWIKHWIMAYVAYGPLRIIVSVIFYYHSGFLIILLVLVVLFGLYRFWAVDVVRQNSRDPWIEKNVRLIQTAVVLSLFSICIGKFGGIASWMKYEGMLSGMAAEDFSLLFWGGWSLFAKIILVLSNYLLFIGVKGLIRSDLFASESSALASFAEQPEPRKSFFTAPICGAIAGWMLCCSLAWLVMVYLGEWEWILS